MSIDVERPGAAHRPGSRGDSPRGADPRGGAAAARFGNASAEQERVVSPRELKDLFRHHPSGVAIITLQDAAGTPLGFTATSVISVSAEPPLLAFSITDVSSAWPALRAARRAVVHFLGADQAELSTRFATPGIDRFAGVAWEPLPTGEPLLTQVTDWALVELTQLVPAGSSHLVVATVLQIAQERPGRATPRLVYVDRTYHRLA